MAIKEYLLHSFRLKILALVIFPSFLFILSALAVISVLRTRLSELGEVDVDKLASECAAHPLMRNNPVEMTQEKLAELFRTLA